MSIDISGFELRDIRIPQMYLCRVSALSTPCVQSCSKSLGQVKCFSRDTWLFLWCDEGSLARPFSAMGFQLLLDRLVISWSVVLCLPSPSPPRDAIPKRELETGRVYSRFGFGRDTLQHGREGWGWDQLGQRHLAHQSVGQEAEEGEIRKPRPWDGTVHIQGESPQSHRHTHPKVDLTNPTPPPPPTPVRFLIKLTMEMRCHSP